MVQQYDSQVWITFNYKSVQWGRWQHNLDKREKNIQKSRLHERNNKIKIRKDAVRMQGVVQGNGNFYFEWKQIEQGRETSKEKKWKLKSALSLRNITFVFQCTSTNFIHQFIDILQRETDKKWIVNKRSKKNPKKTMKNSRNKRGREGINLVEKENLLSKKKWKEKRRRERERVKIEKWM